VPASLPSLRPERQAPEPGVRFVPARWLVAAVHVSRVLLRGGKLGKLGIAGLVWAVMPRKLKLVAWILVFGAAIVLLGSLAALALLAMQLS
jgi:hypothetical protein